MHDFGQKFKVSLPSLFLAKLIVHDFGQKFEVSLPSLFLAKLIKKSVWQYY